MIDFGLPDDLVELRDRVTKFIHEEIMPYEADPRQEYHGPTEELRLELVAKSRAAGLLSPHGPVEFGGLGLNHVGMAVVFEAAGYSTLGPLALNIQAPDEGNTNLLHQVATQEQKERWLAPMVRGEIRSVFSMTEPDGAGSDPSLMRTEARPDGDDYIINGSKMFITNGLQADWMCCLCNTSDDGIHKNKSLIMIPMDTPGLKFICRDSVSVDGNLFDHPISSRFDEQDAFVIFDDVEVPRERLFIDENLEVYNLVMSTSWWPNIMQQTMIRAHTKLEFARGLVIAMAGAINRNQPPTQEMMGEIAMFTEFARASVYAAEQASHDHGNGFWCCDVRPLMALRAALTEWFPRVNEIIRRIGSHNLLTTPSRAALDDPDLRPLIDTYLRGVGVDAEGRDRIFRLAWDFAGSALGSRNEQYERFYLGSTGRALMSLHDLLDRGRTEDLVNRFLSEDFD